MSDSDTAISEWRARLAACGSLTTEDLDELESHLRDHLDALEEVGITGADAIAIALAHAGDAGELGDEYAKAHPLRAWAQPVSWAALGLSLTLLGDGLSRAAIAITLHGGLALDLRVEVLVPMLWRGPRFSARPRRGGGRPRAPLRHDEGDVRFVVARAARRAAGPRSARSPSSRRWAPRSSFGSRRTP